nr:uncharacterized protein LOC109397866 [Aedes albopictus]
MDFELMFPDAGFNETWEALQEKILDGHINLHSYIKSKFVRALVIIKEKNPSRGAKRTIDGSRKITNLLERIIEWINPEDDVEQFATSYSKTKLPVLVMKAQQYEEGPAYVLLDKRIIPAGCDVSGAFLTLVQTYFIFKLKFEPAFANFFNFFVGAVLKIENLATTVDNFLFSLN